MKKLVLSTFAAVALGAFSGAVLADAECQAGSAWGYKEGCGGPSPGTPQGHPPYYVPPPGNNSGWPPVQPGDPYGYAYGYGNRAYVSQAAPAYPYAPPARANRRDRGGDGAYNRRDRDGDGVSNRRDRFPDDPRRW